MRLVGPCFEYDHPRLNPPLFEGHVNHLIVSESDVVELISVVGVNDAPAHVLVKHDLPSRLQHVETSREIYQGTNQVSPVLMCVLFDTEPVSELHAVVKEDWFVRGEQPCSHASRLATRVQTEVLQRM